jgi:hypothetical protein
MTTVQRSGVAVLLCAAALTLACGRAKTIDQVLADPGRYRNQTITVRGTVAQSVSIVGRGAYRIVDGDQGLWVVTASGAPPKGARVDVTGTLQDGYDLGTFGALLKLPESMRKGLVLLASSHTVR